MKSFILLFIIGSILSCNKTPDQPENGNLLPPPFDIVLLDKESNPIIISANQDVKLFYFEDGEKLFIKDFEIKEPISSPIYQYYVTTVFAPLYSGTQNIKTFYLQIDNKKIDTIWLDVKHFKKPIDREYNIYQQVKFNGKLVDAQGPHLPALWILKQE